MKNYFFILFLFLIFLKINAQKDSLQKKIDSLDGKLLSEIIIKAQHKKQFIDKAIYTFDKEAIEQARFAKDLLETLPELQLDPVSNTLKSTKGLNTLFLINGIKASDMQIKSIAQANVVKIEYYDIVPARWATIADIVVNIITRNQEVGYNYGADLTSALTTGFINGSAYAGYTKGKNDFGLEYAINLRDYDDRRRNKKYEYLLNNQIYNSEEKSKDHFGYTYQNIALRYNNSETDKYVFQIKTTFDLFNDFSNLNGNSIYNKGIIQSLNSILVKSSMDYINPNIDVYYSKKIGKKDELSLNFVGAYYNTNSYILKKEWITETNESIFNNDMMLKIKQQNYIGEIAHSHSFTKGKLNSGYRFNSEYISNDLKNLEGTSNYDVTYQKHYFYTEFSGKKDKFSYRINAGLLNIKNQSAENKINNWNFTPNITLGYQLNKNQTLKLTSSYKIESPSGEALSSNIVQSAPNIVSRGNPLLIPEKILENKIIYSFNNNYFDFNTGLGFKIIKDVINEYYLFNEENNNYELTYQNADKLQKFNLELSGSIKPFKTSIFVIKLALNPTFEKIQISKDKILHTTYIENWLGISSKYKSFTFNYKVNIPVYSLDGAFLSTNENKHHFTTYYKYKNWSFSSGVLFIGQPSKYDTKSTDISIVNYQSTTEINNNNTMFILGLSYDFSIGKSNKIDKKLNNQAGQAVTF